jgi:N-acetylglucosaminyldiphosphoundecaprenol N-acetyl-beta-D-mannosaminyltransferase
VAILVDTILLVQLADIGDLILATPALAALREARPEAHIGLLIHQHVAPILEGTGLADEIITIDRDAGPANRYLFTQAHRAKIRSAGHFDTIVYLHHFTLLAGTLKHAYIAAMVRAHRRIGLENGHGWFLTERVPDQGFGALHQAEYWLKLVERLGADARPRPATIAVDRHVSAESIGLPRQRNGPIVTLHGGSGGTSPARRWDRLQFARVADALQEDYNATIVLVGREEDGGRVIAEAMHRPVIDLTGRTTLSELAAVLRLADAHIGADSGVSHIATAVGTPTVTLFGPSNHQAWAPWAPQRPAEVVRSGVACSPCSYVGHQIGLRNGCDARTCMKLIRVRDVLEASSRLLAGIPAPAAPTAPAEPPGFNRQWILGLPVDGIRYDEWMALTAGWVQAGGPARHVCTINPEFMMIARDDVNFAQILSRASLCLPDGVGLLWAARRRGHPLPERVTGSDGIHVIAANAARHGWRLYLLGAAEGVAARAADTLAAQYPGLQIAGTYSGSPAADEEDALAGRIAASRADVLLVAFGAPQQDKWIARNLPRLGVAMAMGVGGAFDFVAGAVPRAPAWMRDAGLEWLYRLLRQPWRWRRMLRLPRFVALVLWEGISRRKS